MATVWVVVADRLRARIFEAEHPLSPLRERRCLVHGEARLHERDLASDKPGRRTGGPGAHGVEEGSPRKEQEALRFAREIADCLGEAADHRRFERLVLCAGPRFLGLLRAELPEAVRERVSLEVRSDLAHIERPEAIREHLPERL